jgi:hypothetical protein
MVTHGLILQTTTASFGLAGSYGLARYDGVPVEYM